VASFLPDAPIHFNVNEIREYVWTAGDQKINGFPGLTAAVNEAAEKLNFSAPMEELVAFTSPDGTILIKFHWIQPEVQLMTGGMAANKEFDSMACEKTWTLSWKQNMGKFSLEKYKFSIETVDDVLTISVIPYNPVEKTFAEDSDPLKIIDLFRCAHFPVKNGNRRRKCC
jgi:hypothetical protein